METVAELFRLARAQKGWSPQKTALHAGYENVDRGANCLLAIEQGQTRIPEKRVWVRFADALGIDHGQIQAALNAEQAIVCSIRFEPYLVVKPLAGFYSRHPMPDGLSKAEQIAFAAQLAAEKQFPACVVFGPRDCTYVTPEGEALWSDRPPHMRPG